MQRYSQTRPKQFGLSRLFMLTTVVAVVCAGVGGLYRYSGDAWLVALTIGIPAWIIAPLLVLLVASQIPLPHHLLKSCCDVVLALIFLAGVIAVAANFQLLTGVLVGLVTYLFWLPQLGVYMRWRATDA